MPRPAKRSRSLRRIKKKIPGGALITHYLRRKPSKAKCANCKKELSGVASKRPKDMKKLAKSQKSATRKYGGNLCPTCTKQVLKAEARSAKV